MGRSLFVHADPRVLETLSKRFPNAIVAPALSVALKHLANPETHIHSIFLDPEDFSYSPLRFIEACFIARPVTPVYVFLPNTPGSPPEDATLMEEVGARGWVNPQSIDQLILRSEDLARPIADPFVRAKAPETHTHAGYHAIPLTDFHTGMSYPLDLFVEGADGSLRLFALAQTDIEAEYFSQLHARATHLFVDGTQLLALRKKLKLNSIHPGKLQTLTPGWRASEVFARSHALMQDIRTNGIQESTIDNTTEMLQDLFRTVHDLQSLNPGSLERMIERSRKSNQALTAAILSFLVCQSMRFERSSTIEILGVASVLQDIALLETPYGDLSTKPASTYSNNEMMLYLQHPTTGADLLEQHVTLPAVTLQVIRQSHERRDRTGFPNRVGGNQLHPMSEILSMINCYLDLRSEGSGPMAAEMESAVYPHYSEKVAEIFRQVLTTLRWESVQS
jgi:response regulator RpfG family c-di-GMP phosphodiesterase